MSIIIAHQTKQFFFERKMKNQVTCFGAVLLGIFYQIRILIFFSQRESLFHITVLGFSRAFLKLSACFKVSFCVLRDETQEFKVIFRKHILEESSKFLYSKLMLCFLTCYFESNVLRLSVLSETIISIPTPSNEQQKRNPHALPNVVST